MSSFSVCWNRRRLAWRRHSERAPWQLEAILCERVLLGGRPQLRIVGRLAGILEEEIDTPREPRHILARREAQTGEIAQIESARYLGNRDHDRRADCEAGAGAAALTATARCSLIQAESASSFNELLCTQKRTQTAIWGFWSASLRHPKIARTD